MVSHFEQIRHKSLAHKGLRIFRFCIVPWKDEREPNNQIMHGETDWRGSKVHPNTELWTNWWWANGIRVFPGFTTLQLVREVQELLSRLSVEPDQKRSSTLLVKTVHKGEWDRVAEQMMLTFAESKHPIFRSTIPLSRGVLKSKGGGKLSIRFCADGKTVETVFRTIVSGNQLSIYGAISDMCQECNTCQDRTGRPVVAGQI